VLNPPFLTPGDRVSIIAPSGALSSLDRIAKGIEIWRSRGYEIELCPGCDGAWGYLAGTDGDRRQQLAAAWHDRRSKAIVCTRGGYGTTRLLENWHWDNTVKPQWVIGFSDITGLLWSLYRHGIASLHAPVLTTLADEPETSRDRLFDFLEGREIAPLRGIGWGGGTATGPLLPGNLTVATALLGTRHQPSLQGAIVAFEDVGEAPYRLDRLLTQWRMSGVLAKVAGVALGRFSDCEGNGFTVAEVLRDRLGDLNLPVVSDLPWGHDGENAALPVGINATIDGDRGTLSFRY